MIVIGIFLLKIFLKNKLKLINFKINISYGNSTNNLHEQIYSSNFFKIVFSLNNKESFLAVN